jgi:hypothetical protein
VYQTLNDIRPRECVGFYAEHGGREQANAVMDKESSFSIVAKRLIETSNPRTPCPPTSIEDSLGNRYTQIGTVELTWFRYSRPSTFVVEFAVVEEDTEDMILGKRACEDSEIQKELELLPFGLPPGPPMTKVQEEEVRRRREQEAQAQAAAERERRNRDQQAAHSGPRQSQL